MDGQSMSFFREFPAGREYRQKKFHKTHPRAKDPFGFRVSLKNPSLN